MMCPGSFSERLEQERPKAEEAKEQNARLRSELLGLRTQQVKLSQSLESGKKEYLATLQLCVSQACDFERHWVD
jgi:hypothetical protein